MLIIQEIGCKGIKTHVFDSRKGAYQWLDHHYDSSECFACCYLSKHMYLTLAKVHINGWTIIMIHLCFACCYLLQLLADGVIPNEYGINPMQKLKIGSKVMSLM